MEPTETGRLALLSKLYEDDTVQGDARRLEQAGLLMYRLRGSRAAIDLFSDMLESPDPAWVSKALESLAWHDHFFGAANAPSSRLLARIRGLLADADVADVAVVTHAARCFLNWRLGVESTLLVALKRRSAPRPWAAAAALALQAGGVAEAAAQRFADRVRRGRIPAGGDSIERLLAAHGRGGEAAFDLELEDIAAEHVRIRRHPSEIGSRDVSGTDGQRYPRRC